MAYRDALFQLGMDLTRSSTAQKEDHGVAARVAQRVKTEQRSGEGSVATTRSVGVSKSSQHLIIDLSGASGLDCVERVENTLKGSAVLAGTELTHVHLHRLALTGGVSGVASLADSHISIRTWPESGHVEIDVLVDHKASWHDLVDALRRSFDAEEVSVREQKRGELARAGVWQAQPSNQKPVRLRKARAA